MADLIETRCSCGYPVHITVDGVCPRCKSREFEESSEGIKLKEEGMRLAATGRRADALHLAQRIARRLAEDGDGTCNMDMVCEELDEYGIKLGPAAGSVFKGSNWVFTGERILSRRVKNHARELKIWRLVGRNAI